MEQDEGYHTAPGLTIETEILVVGGGPVDVFTSYQLAQYGVPSMLIERNLSTTKFAKMAFSSGRSVELFHRSVLAEVWRARGGPPHYSFDQIICNGLGERGKKITTWVRREQLTS